MITNPWTIRFVFPFPFAFPEADANEKNDVFSSLSTNLKGSASRLTRSARRGDTVAVLKVAGICVAVGIVVWLLLKWIF